MPSDDERVTYQADCQALSEAPCVVAGRIEMPTLEVGGKASAGSLR